MIATQPNTGKRFASGAIDYIIILAFTFAFVMIFGQKNPEGGKTVSGPLALIPLGFWVFWLIIPETLWGTTLGHKINDLYVISLDGAKPNFGQVLKRRICDIIEIMWCLGLIAFVLIKNTQFNQRLGDIWAKTLVVDKGQIHAENSFEFEDKEYSS